MNRHSCTTISKSTSVFKSWRMFKMTKKIISYKNHPAGVLFVQIFFNITSFFWKHPFPNFELMNLTDFISWPAFEHSCIISRICYVTNWRIPIVRRKSKYYSLIKRMCAFLSIENKNFFCSFNPLLPCSIRPKNQIILFTCSSTVRGLLGS